MDVQRLILDISVTVILSYITYLFWTEYLNRKKVGSTVLATILTFQLALSVVLLYFEITVDNPSLEQMNVLSFVAAVTMLVLVLRIRDYYTHLERLIEEQTRAEEELQRSLEDLERSNRELDDYAYVISHDLRAPLRTISAFSKFLMEDYSGKMDERDRDYLRRIIDASARMDKLTNQLLVLSRVGRKYLETEFVDLNKLMDEIKLDFELQVVERGAEIITHELPTVNTQRVWMRQLLTNLICNGLKFNKSPTPRVDVACEEREKDHLFSVKDNGIGIEEKFHERIFQKFQRLHSPDEYPGTGAGLAICRKIVEFFGGAIWVESRLGEGSTFYFTFPKEKMGESESEPRPHSVHLDLQVGEEPPTPLEKMPV